MILLLFLLYIAVKQSTALLSILAPSAHPVCFSKDLFVVTKSRLSRLSYFVV